MASIRYGFSESAGVAAPRRPPLATSVRASINPSSKAASRSDGPLTSLAIVNETIPGPVGELSGSIQPPACRVHAAATPIMGARAGSRNRGGPVRPSRRRASTGVVQAAPMIVGSSQRLVIVRPALCRRLLSKVSWNASAVAMVRVDGRTCWSKSK